MKATFQTITPILAQMMLDRSDFRNRNMKRSVVRRYANDMLSDRWKENGESIILDTFGSVIDGQHRLRALVLSGKSYRFIVVQGVLRDAFDTFDIGKNRTSSDTLEVSGLKDCKNLAAVLRSILDYKSNGDLAFTRKAATNRERSFDVMAALREYPLAVNSSHFCHVHRGNSAIRPRSMIGTFHYLFGEKHSATRDEFFERLLKMDFRGVDCPVKALASVHQNIDSLKSMATNRTVHAAYWIKSWNAFRKGSKLKKLSFAPDHHEFPSII
jgi:hypothetical protein